MTSHIFTNYVIVLFRHCQKDVTERCRSNQNGVSEFPRKSCLLQCRAPVMHWSNQQQFYVGSYQWNHIQIIETLQRRRKIMKENHQSQRLLQYLHYYAHSRCGKSIFKSLLLFLVAPPHPYFIFRSATKKTGLHPPSTPQRSLHHTDFSEYPRPGLRCYIGR